MRLATFAALATAAIASGLSSAQAANLGDSSAYNTPFGMTSQAQQNTAVDPSLRDSNGNLTMVDGQFLSSSYASGYGLPGPSVNGAGVGLTNSINGTTTGTGASGAAYGGASAIGNSLNVVTVGNGNTVIVDTSQVNNGNQTATTTVSGH